MDLAQPERALEGDLDWITMKALEKDRVRRYATAHALALDVERHLNDEPVLAGPPSGLYRVRKLVQRDIGARSSRQAPSSSRWWSGLLARRGRWCRRGAPSGRRPPSAVEARRQTAIAETVNAFLNQDLLAAVARRPGADRARTSRMREVLDVAAERIEHASKAGGRFAGEPLVEAAIRTTLGATYRELGEYAAAEPQLRRGARASPHRTRQRCTRRPYG